MLLDGRASYVAHGNRLTSAGTVVRGLSDSEAKWEKKIAEETRIRDRFPSHTST